jgi:phage portal protein BeeE
LGPHTAALSRCGRATVYPPAYQQVLKGLPAVNYSARDVIYRPRNVRAHKVYGYSPVQQVLMTVNIALRRQLWQLDYFTEGSIPDALIGVPQSWASIGFAGVVVFGWMVEGAVKWAVGWILSHFQ